MPHTRTLLDNRQVNVILYLFLKSSLLIAYFFSLSPFLPHSLFVIHLFWVYSFGATAHAVVAWLLIGLCLELTN